MKHGNQYLDQDRAKNKNVLSNKWVFKVKDDETYKAGLVVRGCEQKYKEDFDQTFNPVIGNSATRLILSLAAKRADFIAKFDIKIAFLYGQLNEEDTRRF